MSRRKAAKLSGIFMVEEVEIRPVKKLVSYANNPKEHPDWQIERLARLIETFGFLVPIVIDKKGEIAAGEGRLLAAKRLGMKKVPTVRAEHLSEAQLRAFRIADNQAAKTGWWEEALRAEIKGLEEMGVDLTLTGFSLPELELWREPPEPPSPPGPPSAYGGPNDSALPDWLDELVDKWAVAEGQIWEIPSKALPGKAHRLVCGDSRDPAVVEALMAGAKAAMVYTDPPYGVDYISGKHDRIANDELQRDELVAFLCACFKNLVEHTDDEGAFYIWHASETRELYAHAMKLAGLQERQYLIWAKESLVLGWADYHWSHEPFFYASKAGWMPKFYGGRRQQTVWRVEPCQGEPVVAAVEPGLILSDGKGNELYVTSKVPKKKLRAFMMEPGNPLTLQADNGQQTLWEAARDPSPRHATQKPVALAQRAIRNSSTLGEIVLDLFLGSGSTMVGAESEARLCYGAEISPRNVAGILEWMSEMELEPIMADRIGPEP